ncbi:MAG TPA: hypothetical protein VFK05_13040 [Polyangiaceae bacterium]|nr:hypothetical protein [Polyangiaceae bacterium]
MKYGRVSFFTCFVLGLGACRPSRESVSAGEIGCNPDEIKRALC